MPRMWSRLRSARPEEVILSRTQKTGLFDGPSQLFDTSENRPAGSV